MAQGRCSAVLVVILLVSCAAVVHGVDHNVGGATKWIKPDGTTVAANFYEKWAAEQKFTAGDKLVFEYNAAGHSVLQVSESDYVLCSTTTPVKRYTTGNDLIVVPAGPSYWICGVPSHCPAGQRFNITATGTSPSSPGPSGSASTGNIASILHVVAASAVGLIASIAL